MDVVEMRILCRTLAVVGGLLVSSGHLGMPGKGGRPGQQTEPWSGDATRPRCLSRHRGAGKG